MSWNDIAARAGTDKATHLDDGHGGRRQGHGYMDVYEAYLSTARVDCLVEIGVEHGGSLRAWKRIFPRARVIGVDVNPDCVNVDAGGAEVLIGDAAKPVGPLAGVTFDVVVDDGSHRAKDIVDSFPFFVDGLRDGGFYMVEDVRLCGGCGGDDFPAPVPIVLEAGFAAGLRLAGLYRSNLPFVTGNRYEGDFGLCVFRKTIAPGLHPDYQARIA